MEKCSFGCGKFAVKKFKSGKWCCSDSPNSCEAKRKSDSDKKRGIDPFKKAGVPHPRGYSGKAGWNSGKTYEELFGEEKSKEIKEKIFKNRDPNITKKYWESLPENKKEEQRKRCSDLGRITGGYKRGSGKGISGWYRNIWCDSSWELAFLIYHLDHNIPIKRYDGYFEYLWDKDTHRYYPDFEVNNKIYEIKGILSQKELEKIKQATKEIILLTEKDMKIYLNYAQEKYGKKFTKLYD